MQKTILKKLKHFIPLLFLLTCLLSSRLYAQQDSTAKKEKHFKNTVRFNITNPILFNAYILGYERVVGKSQTVNIDFGVMELPQLVDINPDNPDIQVQNNSTSKGYHGSLEYRFYLNKLNKYEAPRGVYLAPYFSYNYFERKNIFTLNTASFQGDVNTDFSLGINALGGELGYQFVFWKRVTLDLVLFGPGIAKYKIKTSLDTTLSEEDEAALFKKINDALADKIPGYSLVIDDKEYEKSGRTNTTSFGYRYMIHLGFRF